MHRYRGAKQPRADDELCEEQSESECLDELDSRDNYVMNRATTCDYDAGDEDSCHLGSESGDSSRASSPEVSEAPNSILHAPTPRRSFFATYASNATSSSGVEAPDPQTAPTPESRYPFENHLPTPPMEENYARHIETFSCAGYDPHDIPTPGAPDAFTTDEDR